jgi:hypothetical protein
MKLKPSNVKLQLPNRIEDLIELITNNLFNPFIERITIDVKNNEINIAGKNLGTEEALSDKDNESMNDIDLVIQRVRLMESEKEEYIQLNPSALNKICNEILLINSNNLNAICWIINNDANNKLQKWLNFPAIVGNLKMLFGIPIYYAENIDTDYILLCGGKFKDSLLKSTIMIKKILIGD